MEKSFEKYKGIHPGKVLSRILTSKKIVKADFARKIGTYAQTLNDILKGKRNLPIDLSLRIDRELNCNEGTFAELQTYFEIKNAKKRMDEFHPDFHNIRTVLFWDTNLKNIDFERQKKGVIQRVFERGNKSEREEIYNFYGTDTIKKYMYEILQSIAKHIGLDKNKPGSSQLNKENYLEFLRNSFYHDYLTHKLSTDDNQLKTFINNMKENELRDLYIQWEDNPKNKDFNTLGF